MAMIAKYHGHDVDLNGLRQRFSLSVAGATLRSLMTLAEQLGFATRPLRAEVGALRNLRKPAILHWDMNHFVVLKSARRGRFVIHDPALGRRTLNAAEFSKHFTGVVLEIIADGSDDAGAGSHENAACRPVVADRRILVRNRTDSRALRWLADRRVRGAVLCAAHRGRSAANRRRRLVERLGARLRRACGGAGGDHRTAFLGAAVDRLVDELSDGRQSRQPPAAAADRVLREAPCGRHPVADGVRQARAGGHHARRCRHLHRRLHGHRRRRHPVRLFAAAGSPGGGDGGLEPCGDLRAVSRPAPARGRTDRCRRQGAKPFDRERAGVENDQAHGA